MPVALVAAAAVTAIASTYSTIQTGKANKAARRAERIRAQRQRVDTIRQARIQQAQVQAQAASQGTGGFTPSSTVEGAVGSFNSQVTRNLNITRNLDTLAARRIRAQQRGQLAEDIGGIVSEGLQAAGSYSGGA